MRRTLALIVGGGPAGAIAALTLARADAPHLLIERQPQVGDALCGGFLSWRTLDTLARLGVEAATLNPRPVTRMRLFAGARMVERALPRAGIGVSRHRLDTVLLDHAARAGAAIERGVAARAIEEGAVRLDDGARLAPDALFLATGKHDLRGLARPSAARGSDPTLGLRVRLPAAPTLAHLVEDAIELHLFDRGYAGVVLQEDGSANVCMAVHRSRLAAAGGADALLTALALENPRLGERLATRGDAPIDAVANVPYGWRATRGVAGCFRLGDQAAVIPSLAGEGMGISIASGESAAQAYLAGGPAAAIGWQRRFARATARPVRVAGLVRAAAEQPGFHAPLLAAARLPGLLRAIAELTRIGAIPK